MDEHFHTGTRDNVRTSLYGKLPTLSGTRPKKRKSRKPRTQEERTATSEVAMTRAAVSLLVERGIAGMTLAEIGKRSGYSRGLVTHRFGSKAGLLGHVHDSIAADWLRRVQAVVGTSTGIVALQYVTDALLVFMLEEPDELRAMYLLRYASIDPSAEYRANVARVNRAHIRALARWIDEGQQVGEIADDIEPQLAAQLLASAIDGLLYRWLVNPDIPIREVQALLRRHIARSLGIRS